MNLLLSYIYGFFCFYGSQRFRTACDYDVILSGGVNHFMPTVTYFQPRWPDCILQEVFIHASLDGFYHMLNAHFTAISISNI